MTSSKFLSDVFEENRAWRGPEELRQHKNFSDLTFELFLVKWLSQNFIRRILGKKCKGGSEG